MEGGFLPTAITLGLITAAGTVLPRGLRETRVLTEETEALALLLGPKGAPTAIQQHLTQTHLDKITVLEQHHCCCVLGSAGNAAGGIQTTGTWLRMLLLPRRNGVSQTWNMTSGQPAPSGTFLLRFRKAKVS